MPIREDTETSNQSRKHPVPQNVMDVEFKVVGDLTVRQMMYLFAGGILVFVFHKSGLPLFWRWVLMIFSGGLAIAVAFIPVQERGLDKWLISFVSSLFTPTQRVWRKSYSPPVYFLADYAQIIKNEILTLTPAKSRNKLDEYLGNIRNASSDFEKEEIEQLSHVKMLLSQSSASTVTATTTAPTLPSITDMKKDEQESKEEYAKAYHESKGSPQIQIDRPLVHTSAEMAKEIPIHTKTTIPSTIAEEDVVDIAKKEAELKKNVGELLSIAKKAREQLAHTTTNEEHKEMRLAFFTKKFSELESEHSTLAAKIEEKKKTMTEQQGDELSDYAKRVASLQKENETLEKELAEIQNQINSIRQAHVEKPKVEIKEVKPLPSPPPVQPTPQPKPAVQTPTLKTRDTEEKKPFDVGIAVPQQNIASTGPAPVAQVTSQQTSKQPDQLLPNILSGVIKSATGALIDSAVILLKNESGDVVRALKSNKIGQFKTQTPLSKGRYTIETVKGKEKFDILSVEVTGAVLSPLHIIAKEEK